MIKRKGDTGKEKLAQARNDAQVLLSQGELKTIDMKEEATQVALDLVAHAKETARQMLLKTNLDVSQIPLICEKIKLIQIDMANVQTNFTWMRWLLVGLVGGVGYIAVELIIHGIK